MKQLLFGISILFGATTSMTVAAQIAPGAEVPITRDTILRVTLPAGSFKTGDICRVVENGKLSVKEVVGGFAIVEYTIAGTLPPGACPSMRTSIEEKQLDEMMRLYRSGLEEKFLNDLHQRNKARKQ